MMTPLYLHIFLSTPGDVAQERTLAHQVIDNLMHDPLLRDKVVLKVVAWDKGDSRASMRATLTPQEAVNAGMPGPSDCDIVVVILWNRMGNLLLPEYTQADRSRYQFGTEYEFADAMTGARKSTTHPPRPQILVYRRTEDITFSPRDPALFQRIEQYQRVQDFFKAFVAPDGSRRGGYSRYATPDDFRADLENDLKGIITRLLATPASKPIAEPPLRLDFKRPERWPGSPFPGLRSFMPDDAPIYFGRGRETDGLIARLAEPSCRFVCVVGASGSGKASLVGAGLIPRLMDNALPGSKDWAWARFTPGGAGDNPFMALASGLINAHSAAKTHYPQARLLADELQSIPPKLDALLSSVLADRPEWAELMLFIDQFEELFTLAAECYRKPFIDLLDSMAKMARWRLVATLRADFYPRCVDYSTLAELLRMGSYPLAAPKAGALYEMITRPADRAGLRFEDGLAQRLLEDTGSDPGALARLAYTLDELYRAGEREHLNHLTLASYDALGGVQAAIGTRTQHIFDALDPDAQAALPGVFHDLVKVDERGVATRQRVILNRITGGDENSAPARLVQALTEARLLAQSKGAGDCLVVEVVHEALLLSWPRLAAWITEAQEDLILLRQVCKAADRWQHRERHPDLLWPHERLLLVYAMLERLKPDLDEVARDFIKPEFDRLMDEINDPATNHRRRALIGDRLAEIGDTRSGVSLRPDGLPDLVWCDVPGGAVTLESENCTFEVPPFKIAQYPITYAQYKAFLDADDGYRDGRWWDGLFREDEPGTQNRPIDNHPAENVSWFDAMAFCRWLSAKLDYEVRLPTEWEWQQAATGGNPDNDYPWGAEWDASKTNTSESGLSRTMAVGIPRGAVPGLGMLDMSGNVWEWCLNGYEEPGSTDYQDDLGRIVAGKGSYSGPGRRVLRGGSWNSLQDYARAASRGSRHPDDRNNRYGFRVVLVGVRPASL